MNRPLFAATFVLTTICCVGIHARAQEPTLAEPQPVVPQVAPPSQQTFAEPEQSPVVPAPEVSASTNEDRFRNLEERLSGVEHNLNTILAYLRLPGAPDKSQTTLDPETGRICDVEKQVKANSDSFKSALVAVQDEVTSVREELSAAKTKIGRLESGPRTGSAPGRLVLQNWMGSEQFVLVNGAGHQIPPGRTVLTVPHSILEVYMPRHEAAKLWGMTNWKQKGDEYEMQIDLRPK